MHPERGRLQCQLSQLSFSDVTGWGSTAYNGTEQPMWSIKEDLSWIHGAHTMKFGYAFTSQRANGFGQAEHRGTGLIQLSRNGGSRRDHGTSGSSFASFLLGYADSGATETIRYLPQTFDYHGFYAQDDWRLTQPADRQFRPSLRIHRCRRWPEAISMPISRQPRRIRR